MMQPDTDHAPPSLDYLASPYTHADPAVMEWRFEEVSFHAARLAREGYPIFCPISHSHPWVKYGVPQDWEFWEVLDSKFLDHSRQILVLPLPGWRESRGVTAEIAIMRKKNRPVRILHWDMDPARPMPLIAA